MYKDRTQNNDTEIHDTYYTSFPCRIIYSHFADYSIAINTTNRTERQWFSAVTESKISIFKGFPKKLKSLKFELLVWMELPTCVDKQFK